MSVLSKIKGAAKAAVKTTAKVANAPTALATKAVAKVAPKPIASLVRKAGALTPTAMVARAALSIAKTPASPAARAAIARTPPAQARAALAIPRAAPKPTIAVRAVAAMKSPTASPPAPPPPAPPPAADPYAGGDSAPSSGGDDSPAEEETPDPYGQNDGSGGTSPPPDADPAGELPDGYLAPGDDGGQAADLGDIDYHAALEGLGDWKSDLENFGKSAALTVGKQALTTIGGKLTAASKPAAPVVAPGMSPVVKVAIGAGGLAAIYLLMQRRGPAIVSNPRSRKNLIVGGVVLGGGALWYYSRTRAGLPLLPAAFASSAPPLLTATRGPATEGRAGATHF